MKILGHKKCPKCDTKVPWVRLYLRAYAFSRWPCSKCGSILKADMKRRAVNLTVYMILVLLMFVFKTYESSVTLFLFSIVILYILITIVADGVQIANNDKPHGEKQLSAEQINGRDA